MLDMAIVAHCSPNMHPVIVQAIVKTESSFNPYAIGVNTGSRLKKQPTSFGEAVSTAKDLLAKGINFDMGLGQINSANMRWLNLSVEQAFTPCSNLKALQYVYLSCYKKAGNAGLGDRMQRAFSCYNTGDMTKGFQNGYVSKVTNNLNSLVGMFPNMPKQTSVQKSLPQPVYTIKNTPRNAVEQRKSNLPTQVPIQAQKADIGVPVHSEDPENIPSEDIPVRVYNSWDIFRDF